MRRALAVALTALTGGTAAQATTPHGVPARVVANQLAASLTISPGRTTVGGTVKARAIVTNTGPRALANVSATLRLDSTGLLVSGSPTQLVGTLSAGQSAKLAWDVCSRAAGRYVLVVEARATRPDGVQLVSDSPGAVLIVETGRGNCR